MFYPRKPSNASACWVSYSFSQRVCAWWQQKQQSQTHPWGCAASKRNTPGSRQLPSGVPAFWPGCGPLVWCRAGLGESGSPHFGKGQTGSQPGRLERSGSRSGSAGSTWMRCSGRRRDWPGWSTGWRHPRGHNRESEDAQTPPVTPDIKRAEREEVWREKPWRCCKIYLSSRVYQLDASRNSIHMDQAWRSSRNDLHKWVKHPVAVKRNPVTHQWRRQKLFVCNHCCSH